MRTFTTMVIGASLLLLAAIPSTAQTFTTRLSPVASDIAMHANIAGTGTATATLSGTKLTINGSFEGLRTPATLAKIHQGTATGVRGTAILDLTVSKALNGSVTGTVDLTSEQVESLRKGKLYIQIYSEKAPDGNLWGWLLPKESK
jgi:hypothetical protein